MEYLDYRLRDKVTFYDVCYTNEFGIRELSREAEPFLAQKGVELANKQLRRFFEALGKGRPVAYGPEVYDLPEGQIDVLLDASNVSPESEEGQMFLRTFGVGAILRWR